MNLPRGGTIELSDGSIVPYVPCHTHWMRMQAMKPPEKQTEWSWPCSRLHADYLEKRQAALDAGLIQSGDALPGWTGEDVE